MLPPRARDAEGELLSAFGDVQRPEEPVVRERGQHLCRMVYLVNLPQDRNPVLQETSDLQREVDGEHRAERIGERRPPNPHEGRMERPCERPYQREHLRPAQRLARGGRRTGPAVRGELRSDDPEGGVHVPGSIAAYDAGTGAEVWRFYATLADGTAGAGVGIWSTPAVDMKRGLGDRLLFGSDFPLVDPARYAAQIRRLRPGLLARRLFHAPRITPRVRSGLLGGNAARLLKMPVTAPS